jgi:hypothetical protein
MADYTPAVQPLTAEQESVRALVKQPTPSVLERVATFRAQVAPGRALPYFVLRGSSDAGVCPSCSEPWSLGGRCMACKAAALMIVDEQLAARLPAAAPAPK